MPFHRSTLRDNFASLAIWLAISRRVEVRLGSGGRQPRRSDCYALQGTELDCQTTCARCVTLLIAIAMQELQSDPNLVISDRCRRPSTQHMPTRSRALRHEDAERPLFFQMAALRRSSHQSYFSIQI
jgi:hypothetical protein